MTYDIFEYVAANNPLGAKAIIHKHGFTFQGVETASDLGEMLRGVVAEEGMPAFKDVLELHPDKEIIVEQFGIAAPAAPPSSGCGCSGCSKKTGKSVAEEYVGSIQQSTGLSLAQGNTFLIAAALILAVAIVSK